MAAKNPLAARHPPGVPIYIPGKGWKHRYGVILPVAMPSWNLELLCWAYRWETGLDPITHLRKALEILQPGSVWHEWREQRFRSLCEPAYANRVGATRIFNISWVGCGAGGKTADAGVFAVHWWMVDPANTVVALCSTSKQKMRQRVWPVVQECWIGIKNRMEEDHVTGPHMLNSTMELQALKGDSKHAVFGQAVEAGELATAVERLKGVHAKRIMLVIDEAPGVEEAIYHCIPNMLKGCTEFVLVNSGNGPLTHIDAFSRVCAPVRGWKSITVDSLEWETQAVPAYQLPPGHCLHFDGTKSPNVRAGKTLYPFLYKWEDWQRVKDNATIQRTPAFWSQDRGFWVPEGFINTVLTEEMIEQGNARGAVRFDGPTTPIGSLDPGFGGDNCTLRFGRMGRLADKRLAVQIDERHVIPILVDAVDKDGKKLPPEYQIADRVMDESRKRGVKPGYFGVEATGTGRGVAAVLIQQWGEIVWIESGGRATDEPASEEDERPAREVFDRRITQQYFRVANFVKSGQLGGLIDDDIIQFCARTYDYVNKKYYLEKKEDLKVRLGRSCDDADSVCVLVEVATRHGMQTIGPRAERMMSQFDREIRLQQRVYAEANLYQEERAPWDADERPLF